MFPHLWRPQAGEQFVGLCENITEATVTLIILDTLMFEHEKLPLRNCSPTCGDPKCSELPQRCSQVHSFKTKMLASARSSQLPDAPRCSQMLPDAPRCSQMLPYTPSCSLMLPDAPRCSQVFPDASSCSPSQMLPDAPNE